MHPALRIFVYWRTLVLIFTPIVLLWIPLALPIAVELPPEYDPEKIFNCAYVVAIMAVYWVTEALPLTVTAFVPIFAFPILHVMTAKSVAKVYVQVGIF